jgi:LPS export ABC transporter protein LptC
LRTHSKGQEAVASPGRKLGFTQKTGVWYNYCKMTKFFKKHWPLAGIGLLLAVVAFYLVQAQKEAIKELVPFEVDFEQGLKLKNIHYTQDDPDEKVKWVLDATEATFSKDKRFVHFKNFRLKLEPENRPSLELEGLRGVYDKKAGTMTLNGNLRGRTDHGYSILTEGAVYHQKKGDIESDDPVKITGPFFSVEGRGLYFNVKKEILVVRSHVTTSVENQAVVL